MHFNFEDLLDIVSSHQVLTIYLALFLVLLVLYKRKTLQKKYKLPPGPTGLPIVGYLPFLGQEPYKKLNGLKKKYGSVFSIQMGMTRVVILGDFEAVSEAFSKPACNGRPHGIFDFAPNGAGFAGANGEEWSEQRKFCIKSMREYGVGRNKWEWIVETEASDLVSLIFSYNGEPLDVGKIMVSSISNNLSTYLLGRRLPLNHPDRIFLDKATEEIFAFYTKSSFLPYFPVIRYICAAIGMGSDAKTMKTMVLCNNLFRKEVEKMKESYEKSDDDNFIVHYQEEMDNYKGKTGHYFNGAICHNTFLV